VLILFHNNIEIDYDRSIANKSIKNRTWMPFHTEYEKPPEFEGIAEDELLLGEEIEVWNHPETGEVITYETGEPLAIPMSRNRRITMVMTGDNDSGKSVLSQLVIYQLRYRFNRLIALIDPKGDSYNMEKPNTNYKLIQELLRYKIQPRGHQLIRLYLAFTRSLGVKGIPFTPSLPNFIGLEKASELDRLAKYIGLERGDPSLPLLSSVIFAKNRPKTIDQMLYAIAEAKKSGVGARTEKLETLIKVKRDTGELGDEVMDIPKLINNYGMVVLQVPLGNEQLNISDNIASLFISSIMVSREQAIVLKKGWCNKPVSIVCDEANKYAGRNTITNSLLTEVTTRFRSIRNTAGLDSILITQHPSYLDDEQVLEADYVFGVRLNMENDINLLKRRVGSNIYNMQELPFVIGEHPKIFWVADKNGGVRYFKPLPAPNSMPKQKS
jgi:hypothetical protein